MNNCCFASSLVWLLMFIAGCLSKPPLYRTPTRHLGAEGSPTRESENSITWVTSKDGTRIAVECAGEGPSLILVHGGIGDRTRWVPLFPRLASRFTVCAMDRRGRGGSGDSPDYSLQKEAADVAAVINSRPGPVFLVGHSYGAVCALEAAFLTDRVSKLALYEPPLQEQIDPSVIARMERMRNTGNNEQALVIFLEEIVMIAPKTVSFRD